MTKLEKLEAAADAAREAADAAYEAAREAARDAARGAWDAYQAELEKQQKENQ